MSSYISKVNFDYRRDRFYKQVLKVRILTQKNENRKWRSTDHIYCEVQCIFDTDGCLWVE